MSTIELSIDLGSSFITIYQRGVGLVLREPALAIATKVNDKYEIREAGYRAQSMLSQSLGGARVISPIKEGSIIDIEMCAMLMSYFLRKVVPTSIFMPKISAIVLISSSLINSDRKAIEKVMLKVGVKEILLVESPLALLSYTGSIGGLFVDIGSGKTEIAAVTNQGIISGCSVNIAGDAYNNAIVDYIADHFDVKIGDFTVEKLKLDALSLFDNDTNINYVTGRALYDGSPKNAKVKASDMYNAVSPLLDDLIEVVRSVLGTTPPELSAEILRKGIFISGGSSQIPGLKEYIARKLALPVTPLEDVENAAAIGGSHFFSDKQFLSDMLGIHVD
ncbi:MAG: rod shape-determining protein [Clostridia bacterium]|nr:rod shape-determining protein [Clostridia bacterium]